MEEEGVGMGRSPPSKNEKMLNRNDIVYVMLVFVCVVGVFVVVLLGVFLVLSLLLFFVLLLHVVSVLHCLENYFLQEGVTLLLDLFTGCIV